MAHWVVIYNWLRSIDMVEDYPRHRGLASILGTILKIRIMQQDEIAGSIIN
jgi:hypothetical protein